jgi:hypothetical protein
MLPNGANVTISVVQTPLRGGIYKKAFIGLLQIFVD